MARRRPSYRLQRELNQAQARETFIRNYTGPAQGTTVQSRGPATELYYRSLSQKVGTDRIIYKVSVDNDTLTQVPAVDAGLLTTLTSSQRAERLRGSGLKPTRLHWYRGDATPTYVTSRYGTTYVRSYVAGSNRSIPFSVATGDFSADDLNDQFQILFGNGGTRRALLGASNGRAYVELERAPISANS
jgi:hypothetical protein